jgi:ceramide glucosyltransferase
MHLELYLVFVLTVLCFTAIGYYGCAIYSVRDFFARPTKGNPSFHPPVTILKPMCGLDSNAYENFASFCQQDYPNYQIIFSTLDPHDPNIAVVRQIIKDFPDADIQLVVSDRVIGTNHKVSNLANAETKAKHSFLLIADSDIRVRPDYLSQVIQPMSDPKVGIVTCIYRSLPQGWIAILEAVGISTESHPAILVAHKLEGIKFAIGATIVIPKSVLNKIGGFQAIADYLEDDSLLGFLSNSAGYQIVLSNYIVEHVSGKVTLVDFIQRQIRWYCGTRTSDPSGYPKLIFTFGTVYSLLLIILTKGAIISWMLLTATWTVRLIMAWILGAKYLQDPAAKKFFWLAPGSDIIKFIFWCYGFFGTTIYWRGRKLKLSPDGKITLAKPKEIKRNSYLMKISKFFLDIPF